jgi:ABC-type antimicrobial peptide transport system permease subunit
MSGLAQLALGAAPIAGGALLGAAAGQLKGPDFRGMLKQDMDLLERIPEDQTQRRAELQRTIDARIDDLVAATDRSRALRRAAGTYQGNWRDIVLFICALLFTLVWWNVSHNRTNWLLMFIVMIIVSVVTAVYAARGAMRSLGPVLHPRRDS